MTGNGKHSTYNNGDDWGMVYYCLTHITVNDIFFSTFDMYMNSLEVVRLRIHVFHITQTCGGLFSETWGTPKQGIGFCIRFDLK